MGRELLLAWGWGLVRAENWTEDSVDVSRMEIVEEKRVGGVTIRKETLTPHSL